MTISTWGLAPGVVAFANDAHMMCVECAMKEYDYDSVMKVIAGEEGWQTVTDHEGNSLNPVLSGSEDLHGDFCEGAEHQQQLHAGQVTPEDLRLCDDDCWCYKTRVDRPALEQEITEWKKTVQEEWDRDNVMIPNKEIEDPYDLQFAFHVFCLDNKDEWIVDREGTDALGQAIDCYEAYIRNYEEARFYIEAQTVGDDPIDVGEDCLLAFPE